MELQIQYRTPDENHVTIRVGFIEHVITQDEYIQIIKHIMRIDGDGSDYIKARNKTLIEYFINGPKEQFSW